MEAFSLTRKAKADLKSIVAYTQRKWGKSQRRVYAKQFDDVFHMLSHTPEAGSVCDYIREGYRKFPCASHIIFYRNLEENKVEIVRILHKRMAARQQIAKP
jgi:toxin ParE1/3/4